METMHSNNPIDPGTEGPGWASWLGIMAIAFGIYLAAVHGTEVLSQIVYAPDTAAVHDVPIDCEEEELVEEGISLEECNLMGTTAKNVILSSPDWFRSFHIGLSAIGTIIAIVSVFIGIALVDYRKGVVVPAILTFGLLLAIDIIGFLAVVNAGPLLRAMYLSDTLLWSLIHLIMIAGLLAGFHSEPE
ncbi:MAG TPA: hypothetical protein VLN56_09480 [Gammaproteobacteria bacterium]|nr:hypothetical protein [Gammaproteobacteria bacterium]